MWCLLRDRRASYLLESAISSRTLFFHILTCWKAFQEYLYIVIIVIYSIAVFAYVMYYCTLLEHSLVRNSLAHCLYCYRAWTVVRPVEAFSLEVDRLSLISVFCSNATCTARLYQGWVRMEDTCKLPRLGKDGQTLGVTHDSRTW